MIKSTQKNVIKLLCVFIFLASPAFGMQEYTEKTEETCISLKSEVNFFISERFKISLDLRVEALGFSDSNNLLIATLEDQTQVTIDLDYEFELTYSKPEKIFTKEHRLCFAVGPNDLFASCLKDVPDIKIWATKTKELLATIKTGMKDVERLVWSKDGCWIAAASGNAVKIWQLSPI